MRALVTGAAGFLGFHLARSLANDGHELVLADNFVRGKRDGSFRNLLVLPNVKFVHTDLCDRTAIVEQVSLAGKFDICFHMAALNGTDNFYEHPWDTLRNSTLPTLNLLATLARTDRCGRFVYASSSEVYAGGVLRGWQSVPTAEDAPLVVEDPKNPRWSYAAGKLTGEVAVVNACRDRQCNWTILRYHNIYGPRMGENGHFIPEFLQRVLRGEFVVFGAEQTRTFMYVDDAIAATRALAVLSDAANQIVNVGSGVEVRVIDVAREMTHILGVEGPIGRLQAKIGSVDRRVPDLRKLYRLLPDMQWTPFNEGLRATVAYYREVFS